MTRTVAREIAIQLSFAAQLAGDDARETADTFFSREYFATLAEEDPLFLEYPDEKQLDYIRRLTGLVYDHMYELNHMIEKYARGWRLERISRVAAAIMRCAMRMSYPRSVSRISSAFGTASSAAFDGVAARRSATKSEIVTSGSCPTADMTGMSES